MSDRPSGITPTQRTLRILESFGHRSSWGVRELAAHLGLSSSAVHRTLQELAAEGVVHVDEAGAYESAAGMLRLGAVLARASSLPRVAEPHLEAARDQGEETVILLAYDAAHRRCTAVAAAESPRPVRYISESLRGWNELHLGATGKGILAFLDTDDQEAVLATLADPLPGPAAMTKDQLRDDLALARQRGWASSVGERYAGARGVAAPVYDHSGQVIGSVAIGWPDHPEADRRVEELGALCRQTADAVSAELGAMVSTRSTH